MMLSSPTGRPMQELQVLMTAGVLAVLLVGHRRVLVLALGWRDEAALHRVHALVVALIVGAAQHP